MTVENMQIGEWVNQWKKEQGLISFGLDLGKSEEGHALYRAWANAPSLPKWRFEDVHKAEDIDASNAKVEHLRREAFQANLEWELMNNAVAILAGIDLIREKGTSAQKDILQRALKG